MEEVRGPRGEGEQQGGGPGNMAVGVDCEPGLCVDSQHIAQISALEPGSRQESSDVLASSRPFRKRKRTPSSREHGHPSSCRLHLWNTSLGAKLTIGMCVRVSCRHVMV